MKITDNSNRKMLNIGPDNQPGVVLLNTIQNKQDHLYLLHLLCVYVTEDLNRSGACFYVLSF